MRANASGYAVYPSLNGRRALITGGASGIGAALLRGFAEQGANVAFLDIQDEEASELIAQIAAAGHAQPRYWHCDLTDADLLRSVVRGAIAALGGLEVLVNNAGNDQRHRTDEVTPEQWDALMAINLRQQFFVTQAALPALRASGATAGWASVIHMSSIAWRIPSVGLPAYVAAKAAVVGLARTLAREEGIHGVRVNSIEPGAILTEKQKRLWVTPEYSAEILVRQAIKRHLEPDEVVRLALFLAAADSSAITGQSYVVDGGWV